MPTEKLRDGFNSPIHKPLQCLIRTEKEWIAYWKNFSGESKEPAPKVDFKTKMVVVVHLGTRRTGGYSVKIESVKLVDPKTIKITYVETTPSPTDFVTQMMTYPFTIVKVDQTPGDVKFEKKTQVRKRD